MRKAIHHPPCSLYKTLLSLVLVSMTGLFPHMGRAQPNNVLVDFDNPAPIAQPNLNGVFEGIDFGTDQWAWSGAYGSNSTNHIYFSASANARSFSFVSGPQVLQSIRVYTGTNGMLTLSDSQGQSFTQNITTGSMQTVAPGWSTASNVITISFTASWELGLDDIVYGEGPVNQTPTAVIAEPDIEGMTISLDGGQSSDPNGEALSYRWDFGDSNTGNGETVTHTYSEAGEYVITLTVDNGTLTDDVSVTITISDSNVPDLEPILPDDMPRPALNASFFDSKFGSRITRITDNVVMENQITVPVYSQLQAWNADQNYLVLVNGSILDAETYQVVHQVEFPWPSYGEGLRWSPTEPLVMYYTGGLIDGYDPDPIACGVGQARLMRYRLLEGTPMTGTPELVECFEEYTELAREISYQDLSNDGRYVALMGVRPDGRRDMFAYDVISNIKGTVLELPSTAVDPDWAAMSPSGRYIVVSYSNGFQRYQGVEAYDRVTMDYVGKVALTTGHGDMTMDEEGNEYYVQDNASNAYLLNEQHYMIRANIPIGVLFNEDGTVDENATVSNEATIPLMSMDWFFGTHTSCRNIQELGWCIVSTMGGEGDGWQALESEVFRLYIDSTLERVHLDRLAHHRSDPVYIDEFGTFLSYWAEPHATVSPNGQEIIYGSTWGENDFAEAYVIDASITVLGALTQNMMAGSWAQLPAENLGELTSSGPVFNIAEYANSATWDPVNQQLYYSGSGHEEAYKFIRYNARSNIWEQILPDAPWLADYSLLHGTTHGYDHNALNPSSRTYYYRPFSWPSIYTYNIDTDIWNVSPLSPIPDYNQYNYVAGGVAHFPEIGGLIVVTQGKVDFYNETSKRWSTLAEGLEMGPYHNFVEYNPIHQIVLFGGGNNDEPDGGLAGRRIYQLDAQGNITAMTPAPSQIPSLGSLGALVTVDPVSGEYLVMYQNVLHAYNVVQDSWRVVDSSAPVNVSVFAAIATAISNYQVTMYIVGVEDEFQNRDTEAWLYKHADSSPAQNQAPNAVFSSSSNSGLSISFDASQSSDPDDDALTYGWNFGDGNSGSDVTVEHTYADAGEYSVTLTVSDGQLTDTENRTVIVSVATENRSLRFYGNGVNAPDQDRVKIRIDDPATSNDPPYPADIGGEDFTLEFWMKAQASDNTGSVECSAYGWISGNIMFDRDRFGQDRTFGIALDTNGIAFGVQNESNLSQTLCTTTDLRDNQWHHIAMQRRRSDGYLWIYVDGVLAAEADGPDGDISYPDDGVPGDFCGGPCTNSDPFLVIAAEKHDASVANPSYSGLLDEIRLSNSLRYSSNFTPFTQPFVSDENTVALYHLDEGQGTVMTDTSGVSGGPSHGMLNVGGNPAGPVWVDDSPF